MEVVTLSAEQVAEKYAQLGLSAEKVESASKAPVGEIPTGGKFADVEVRQFVDDKGVEHLYPVLLVVDNNDRKTGFIPVASILRQVCTEVDGKIETFEIKSQTSVHKGKYGVKSTRLNAGMIYGSETEIVSDLLGRTFTIEIVKDVKVPLIQKGGTHFKKSKAEAAKMFEVKPQSPKFITLD